VKNYSFQQKYDKEELKLKNVDKEIQKPIKINSEVLIKH